MFMPMESRTKQQYVDRCGLHILQKYGKKFKYFRITLIDVNFIHEEIKHIKPQECFLQYSLRVSAT
jgi:hypothetical protein